MKEIYELFNYPIFVWIGGVVTVVSVSSVFIRMIIEMIRKFK